MMHSANHGSNSLTIPLFDEESRGFWEGTSTKELRIQMCSQCRRFRFPPRVMCPFCRSTTRHWETVSGRGTLWSYVVPHPPLLPAYAELAPYNVIVVALDEDPTIRLVGNLLARADGPINEVDPVSIEIGEPVSVVFSPRLGPDGTEVLMPEWIRSS